MNSFQNQAFTTRSSQTQKCAHGRYSKRYFEKQTSSNKDRMKLEKKIDREVTEQNISSQFDPHKQMLKSIISMNQEYFQNKLKFNLNGKSKDLKLKIPSKTGFTVYKKDYVKNNKGKNEQQNQTHMFKPNKYETQFNGNTTYRHEYLGLPNRDDRHNRRQTRSVDPDAPLFFETQYGHNFQNWGADSFMPSMKPQHNPAGLNLPFQNVSVYNSDFSLKVDKKNKSKPNRSCTNFNCSKSSIISNKITNPLLYMTTSNQFFNKKECNKQNSAKPKTQTLAVQKSSLKGKTQYQSEYIPSNQKQFRQSQKLPLAHLQSIILNL